MSSRSSAATPEDLLSNPSVHLTTRQSLWLRPLTPIARFSQATLYQVNRWLMRRLFSLDVSGLENIPADGPFILASNHTSSLDPSAIAAAVSLQQFRSLRWAARKGVVTGGWLREAVARIARVIPIRRSIESLAAASSVLERGENLVWFPEGTRSVTGELQSLKSGIGHLATHHQVPIVPILIRGAHEAMPPPRKRLRRLSEISVEFGEPIVEFTTSEQAVELLYVTMLRMQRKRSQ